MLDPSILVTPNAGSADALANPALLSSVPGSAAASAESGEAAQRVEAAELRARSLATAIELLASLDESEDLQQASESAVRLLEELLGASRVLILWRQVADRGLSVIADSNAVESDHRLTLAAGEEIAARGETLTQWPPSSTSPASKELDDDAAVRSSRHALLAVAQLARESSAESILAARLCDAGGRDQGVVLAINSSTQTALLCLDAIAAPLASKLIGVRRAQPTRLESALRGVVDAAHHSRRMIFGATALLVMVAMLLPLRYRVRAELELQPVEHRYIAVPFDGPLESARVRPGDTVQRGQLLATINPREIEYELAGVRADLNRALQEKKGMMAQHDVAGSKIAALESDRLRLQSDLLQYQRDNLEIRSPIDGVVVSGDLKQSEGMPMSRGENLFEIAPLGQMVVELAVAESDFIHVRPGMPVDFYLYAMPNRKMSGTVARVHPRAELRDHDNVFIAEVELTDADNVLRPGMRGRAKIAGDRHPLGWNLFHKAYYALCRVVGW